MVLLCDKAWYNVLNISAARKENGDENIFKGCTDVPVYIDLDLQSGEDWEAGNVFRFNP